MITNSSKVIKRSYSFKYGTARIAYDVWQTGPDVDPEAILFLGAGQVGLLAQWVAEHCPPGTLVVQGMPHWLVSDVDVITFAYTYIEKVISKLVPVHNLSKVNVLAESQAAAATTFVFANTRFRALLKDFVLIQPLGLNPAAYSKASNPLTIFARRTAQNLKSQLPQFMFESRLRHNARQLSRIVNFRNPILRAHYESGLKSDLSPDLLTLHHTGHRIAVIIGTKDALFPPNEIAETLQKNGLAVPLFQLPAVPHSPLATRYGIWLLDTAFESLKMTNR